MAGYSPEEIEAIAGWLRERQSARMIASLFTRTFRPASRSAIVGIIHRDPTLRAIGLAGSKPAMRHRGKPGPTAGGINVGNLNKRVAARASAKAFVAPSRDRAALAYDESCMRLPLVELGRYQCRWPVNEAAAGEPHLFCGRVALTGSYCPHHAARAEGRGTDAERGAHRALLKLAGS